MNPEVTITQRDQTEAIIDYGNGTRFVIAPVRPRRRDAWKVLRGKHTPQITVAALGIGQFMAPPDPHPWRTRIKRFFQPKDTFQFNEDEM